MLSDTFNSTAAALPPSLEWPRTFRSILVLIICGLITILTILGSTCFSSSWKINATCLFLGNGLVLLSVKFRLHARSYSDYFIVSLCLADFFVGLFVMPLMTVHSLYLRWPFHYRLCYIWMSIDFTCSTASFLTLAAMALDRYYALTGNTSLLSSLSLDDSSSLISILSSSIFSPTQSFVHFSTDLHHQFLDYSLRHLAEFHLSGPLFQFEWRRLLSSSSAMDYRSVVHIFLLYSPAIHARLLFKNHREYQGYRSDGEWWQSKRISHA